MPPVSESLSKPLAAPERSLVQRMEALQRANDIRSRRAQLKRDLKAGRQPIHELLLEPPEYLRDGEGLRPAARRPEVRPREGQQDPLPVPDLAEQDDRRAVRAPARRARRADAPPLRRRPAQRRGARVVAAGVRDHRALRGRQGHADPRPARARPRARAVGLGDDARAAARRARRRRLPLPHRRGVRAARRGRRVRRARRPTRATATGRCAPSSSGGCAPGCRWCSRSRSRARARSAQAMPEAVAVFIAPPSLEALRARLVGRGTDAAEQVEQRLRDRRARARARSPSSPTWSSTTGSSRRPTS